MTRRAVLFVLLACSLSAASLRERVEAAIAASPSARAAFWGIQAINLRTGKTVFELNPHRLFVPASNTKLFTTSLALVRLGADFKFQTRVLSAAPPDSNGRIEGDLQLVGGGDPNISIRPIPYRTGPITGDPLAPLGELADQVAAQGVKRIAGDIVGDDTWYVWEPFAPGWSVDDPLYDYGAAVSALTLHDNTMSLNVQPGAAEGDVAAVTLLPPVEYYQIDNRVRTGPPDSVRKIEMDRLPGSRELKIWGSIPLRNKGVDLLLGIEDPAQYAAMAFRQLLEDRGITVEGRAVARHSYPNQPASDPVGGFALAQRVSAPLLEDLRITDKVSQNLHAELALRAVGRTQKSTGSREAGLEELRAFLTGIGIAKEEYTINDGSGLSRQNLVAPAAVVKLLRWMYDAPVRESWISLLPIGGQDGTLDKRFTQPPAAGRIHAKTGSVAHVSALSGYIEKPGGRWIAFSILVNNFSGPTSEIRAVMDRICTLIME